MKPFAAILLALVLLPACAAPEGNNYFVNRAADFGDMARFNVQVGKGAAIKLEITRVLHFGLGWFDGRAWGWANREWAGWDYKYTDWGLLVGLYDEINTSPMEYLQGSYGYRFERGGGTRFQETNNHLELLNSRIKLCIFLGLDFELRSGEVIDFLAGIFGFDPSGDDGVYTEMLEQ